MMEATERIINSNDWITIILMIVVALFVYNKLNHNERFTKVQSLLFNHSYINDYSKATPLLLNSFHSIFFIIASILISLFFFSLMEDKGLVENQNTIVLFFKIFLFVFIFLLFRAFLGYLLGVLFERESQQQYISFLKMSYLIHFCFMILPFLIIYIYVDSEVYQWMFIGGTVLLLLFYYSLILRENQKLIFSNIFYFILYLCALEIAPFVIIYKTITA